MGIEKILATKVQRGFDSIFKAAVRERVSVGRKIADCCEVYFRVALHHPEREKKVKERLLRRIGGETFDSYCS